MMIIKEHEKSFVKFMLRIHKGFVKGAKEYGEGANRKMDLITEMQAELADTASYAFFEFEKLGRLKERIKRIEKGVDNER